MTALPPTTAVADVLALRGQQGWLSPPLHRVVSAASSGASGDAVGVAGRARTITLRPGPGGFGPLYALLSGDLDGQVLVLSAPSDDVAVWGGLLGTAAAQSGLVAVAVDGAVRDVGDCCDVGVPLWSRAVRTVGPAGALEVAGVGDPVAIGGVTVADGDLVVVDDDGIVALPRDGADAVIVDAAAYADAETAVVSALRDGTALRDAYRLKSDAVARLLP